MILVIGAALFIGFILIFLLKGQEPSVPYQVHSAETPRLGYLPDSKGKAGSGKSFQDLQNFSRDKLEQFCRALITHYKLTFHSVDYDGENNLYILASLDHPLLRGNVIFCGHLEPAPGIVSSSTVISFSDMVKAERAIKGIFITNGYFSEEVMKLNEGASIELLDANQLARLLAEISPELLK